MDAALRLHTPARWCDVGFAPVMASRKSELSYRGSLVRRLYSTANSQIASSKASLEPSIFDKVTGDARHRTQIQPSSDDFKVQMGKFREALLVIRPAMA